MVKIVNKFNAIEFSGGTTAVALIVLCVEVDKKLATRNHLCMLVGMITLSLGIEIHYRRIAGRKIHLASSSTIVSGTTKDST